MARMYLVIDPVRHDGVDYAPGASIDLDAKAAGRLLAVGAIAHDAQPPADVGAMHASPLQAGADPETDPEAGAPPQPNPRSGTTGESPEASGAAALQADSAPQPSNADTGPNTPVGARHASPPQTDANPDAHAPDATPRAPVVPIGSKAAKAAKAKPAE